MQHLYATSIRLCVSSVPIGKERTGVRGAWCEERGEGAEGAEGSGRAAHRRQPRVHVLVLVAGARPQSARRLPRHPIAGQLTNHLPPQQSNCYRVRFLQLNI